MKLKEEKVMRLFQVDLKIVDYIKEILLKFIDKDVKKDI